MEAIAPLHVNICCAPYNADPTGEGDCTEAICRALDDLTDITRQALRQCVAAVEALPVEGVHYLPGSAEIHRNGDEIVGTFCAHLPYVPTLYFPAGMYRVSGTLCYRHADLLNTKGDPLNQQIRIRGAGTGRTVIRLADGAPGFAGSTPRPVISYMAGENTNVATSNYCEDLTINCGAGNPAAVGLDFFANNSGAVRRVEVISDDGRGFAGIQLGHGNYSGILVKHVRVAGFDHGLHIDSETDSMFAHIEDAHVSGQRIAGVTVGSISVSLRNIHTERVPVGVACVHPSGHTALVDSTLAGDGPSAIDRRAGSLYVSNVTVEGFADAGRIDQRVEPCTVGRADGGMPRLPIEQTPAYTPADDARITGVRGFGAIGNGINDDSAAIQRAMASGATGICFEPGRYLLNRPVVIPSAVERIDFGFSDLVAGLDLRQGNDEGFVIAGDGADRPLFIGRLLAWEQWSGEHCTFTHASTRTVCFEDLHTQTLRFYRNTVRGGRVFFDNVATTTGVVPGTVGHGRCAIELVGQKAWARQLNPERGEPMIRNDGGDLVLMGYKSEGTGVVVHTINGGRTEVLGGIVNIGMPGEAAFVAEDAQQRLSTASNAWRDVAYHRVPIRDVRGGVTRDIAYDQLPSRNLPAERGPQYVIPLYDGPADA